jgi:CBS-domain-containing membrane protein
MPMDQVVTAAPHQPLTSLLERLAPSGADRALVVDRGQVVGIVAAIDIGRFIDAHTLAVPKTLIECCCPEPTRSLHQSHVSR